jgi:hypothetical protein
MAKGIHKGSEFNNVNETWNQNERNRAGENAPGQESNAAADRDNIEQTIKQEAAEYDRADKEERLLSGDRASINDEETDLGADNER